MIISIASIAEADHWLAVIHGAAEHVLSSIRAHSGDGMELLKALKFNPVGKHPIGLHELNAIEQINQTFTYVVAIAAAKELLIRHPEAGGFQLAPGAHMGLPLDIMSKLPGLVGAETFAAVDPRNNRKLAGDIEKLRQRSETFRYVFFSSPRFPGLQRRPELEKDNIEVWSVDI